MVVNRRHERLGLRYSKVFVFLAGLACVAILLALLAWQFFPTSPFRTNILLAGDPMMVVSWDGRRGRLTQVTLPASIYINGLSGTGEYSLESLWKLGVIDAKNRSLLSDSVSDVLAIPIPWYIGTQKQTTVKDVFSFSGLLKRATGQYRTNMPLRLFLPMVVSLANIRTDAIDDQSRIGTEGIAMRQRADGSTISFLDPDAVDRLAGTQFEEETIRKESLRVAVKNTTSTPTLGRRMERRIVRAGAIVVDVGNDEQILDRCQVFGSKKNLKSYTAEFLRLFYFCDFLEGESKRADLEVRVGGDFAARYRPPDGR